MGNRHHDHGGAQDHAHEKDHSHGHRGHGHAHGNGDKKTLMIVATLTGGYMIAEIVGGLASGSLALLADAGHMALDTVAVIFGLFAVHISQRAPTRDKTFGYYRAEILAALLNAVTLIATSVWIVFEAWERMSHPAQVQGKLMAMVAAGGLVVNGIAIFLMMRANRDSHNMRGVWLHLLTDALGSVSAIVAAVLVWKFGWTLADPIISALISLLILRGAWNLLKSSVNVLLVAVPDGVSVDGIMRDLRMTTGVVEVHDLHVWAMNTGVNSLTGHVRTGLDVDPGELLAKLTTLLKERHQIEHVTLQIEPTAFAHKGTEFCAPGQTFQPQES